MEKVVEMSARLMQLEVEMELIQEAIVKVKEETKDPEEKLNKVEALYLSYIKSINEFRTIQNGLNQHKERVSYDDFKAKYGDLKELLADQALKHIAKEVITKECWPACTDCIACVECAVSSCVQCAVSSCVQCVINGSGDWCTGMDSLTYSSCSPKPDIGSQYKSEAIQRMQVKWGEKKK